MKNIRNLYNFFELFNLQSESNKLILIFFGGGSYTGFVTRIRSLRFTNFDSNTVNNEMHFSVACNTFGFLQNVEAS